MSGAAVSPAPPPAAPEARTAPPFVSVLVPVRNEAASIERVLTRLLGQSYPTDRFEVVVADGGSTDRTAEIVQGMAAGHANLRYVANPGRLSSAGRNAALRVSVGDVVLVVDGHCDVGSDGHLAALAEAFERSGADCLGRPQPLDAPGATGLQRAVAAARSSWLGHQPASYIYSAGERFVPPQSVAVAYRREVFEQVGYFDETFDACEDVEFNHRVARAGLRCYFTPRIAVAYHPRANLSGLFRQMARYGRGRVRLWRKFPETFSAACFAPAAFLVAVAVFAVAACFSGWAAIVSGALVALYLTAVVAASVSSAAKAREPGLLMWLPAVFLTVHAGAGWGVLAELCRPHRARTAT